jgi:hypothetical protein
MKFVVRINVRTVILIGPLALHVPDFAQMSNIDARLSPYRYVLHSEWTVITPSALPFDAGYCHGIEGKYLTHWHCHIIKCLCHFSL